MSELRINFQSPVDVSDIDVFVYSFTHNLFNNAVRDSGSIGRFVVKTS
jgi:hypothetical protein